MNVLARALIEAELKITGEKLIFYRVAARREDRVAALIGKFKADDLAPPIHAILPGDLA